MSCLECNFEILHTKGQKNEIIVTLQLQTDEVGINDERVVNNITCV